MSDLVWKKGVPKEEGYYWFRWPKEDPEAPKDDPILMEVFYHYKRQAVLIVGLGPEERPFVDNAPEVYAEGEFAGPVPGPPE